MSWQSPDVGTGTLHDARRRLRAELLYLNKLQPVYHEEHGLRSLRELARRYLALTRDLTRVMNRLKAVYRGWAIPCAGQQVYALRYRSEWLVRSWRLLP